MHEPIYIIGANGHRRELGINDPTPRPAPPREIPVWDWPRVLVTVEAGWAPRYGYVRATWQAEDELPDGRLVYSIGIHPEDRPGWEIYAGNDAKVVAWQPVEA